MADRSGTPADARSTSFFSSFVLDNIKMIAEEGIDLHLFLFLLFLSFSLIFKLNMC